MDSEAIPFPAKKPKGTAIDVVLDDWLEILQDAGMEFAQVSYDLSIRNTEFVRSLIRDSPEYGLTIWGRLPENLTEANLLLEKGLHFDAVLAEFAEDPEELEQRFARYEAHNHRANRMLRGVIIESLRGLETLPEILAETRVDIVLPGPFDLSLELQRTPSDPLVQKEILKVIDYCSKLGVQVIASVSTHPGGARGAAKSSATHLAYPGLLGALEIGWNTIDQRVSEELDRE